MFTQGDFSGSGTVSDFDYVRFYLPNYLVDLTGLALADWAYDGEVDAGDYVLWQANEGLADDPWTLGDATGDGLVDIVDKQIWARQLGLQVTVAV